MCFSGGSVVKNLPSHAGDAVSIPGLESPPGEGAHKFCDSTVKINSSENSSCSVIKFLTIEKIFAFVNEWSLLDKAEIMVCQLT